MHLRRRAGVKQEFDRRALLVERYDGNVRARGLGEKRMEELVDRLEALSSEEKNIAKELGRNIVDIAGYQDASIALLLILIARAPAPIMGSHWDASGRTQRHCALRELRVVLGTDDTKGQLQVPQGAAKKKLPDDCLWRTLNILSLDESGAPTFPKLSKLEIKAVRILPEKPEQEELDLSQIVKPFIQLPTLEHFSLSAIDHRPIPSLGIWHPSVAGTTLAAFNLKSLTLRNVHAQSLKQILSYTPNLQILDYTLIQNARFENHCAATYEDLGDALSVVKKTLTSLSLYNYIYDHRREMLTITELAVGFDVGFNGDPAALRLNEFTELRKVTSSIRIIHGPMQLGSMGNGRKRLKDVLPEGLEELRLLEDKGGCINFDIWFHTQLLGAPKLVKRFIIDRGQSQPNIGSESRSQSQYGDGNGENSGQRRLRKVTFVLEFNMAEVERWLSRPRPRLRIGGEDDRKRWPSQEDFDELKAWGEEYGVEVEREIGMLYKECEEFVDRDAPDDD